MSVKGAGSFFGGNLIIVALVVALDVGKIVVVSLIYSYWKNLPVLMRLVGVPMIAIMMVFPSGSAAGFLSGEFQKAMIGTKEGEVKVTLLKAEQEKLEARKKQINDQIANLPANYSRQRIKVMKEFEAEQKQLTARTTAIDAELPALQVSQIGTEAKAGPILYMAKAFDIPVEEAVKWVILMIIVVFDPLAVFLIIAGNFLMDQRKRFMEDVKPEAKANSPELLADEPSEAVVHQNGDEIRPLSQAHLQAILEAEPKIKGEIISSLFPLLDLEEYQSKVFSNMARELEKAVPVDADFGKFREDPTPVETPVLTEDEEAFHATKFPTLEEAASAYAPEREEITKSTLGLVKADPKTIVQRKNAEFGGSKFTPKK